MCGWQAKAPAPHNFYARSSSIFLAAGSSFKMRKLRIWLARAGSLRGLLLWPPFHLDCNMEVSDERSTFAPAGFSSGSAAAALDWKRVMSEKRVEVLEL